MFRKLNTLDLHIPLLVDCKAPL